MALSALSGAYIRLSDGPIRLSDGFMRVLVDHIMDHIRFSEEPIKYQALKVSSEYAPRLPDTPIRPDQVLIYGPQWSQSDSLIGALSSSQIALAGFRRAISNYPSILSSSQSMLSGSQMALSYHCQALR